LFEILNPDDHGRIHAQTIDVEVFDEDREALALLAPLLVEIEELDEPLSFPEFYRAFEILLTKLSPADKRKLLKPHKYHRTPCSNPPKT
jgi:hypothetical protein